MGLVLPGMVVWLGVAWALALGAGVSPFWLLLAYPVVIGLAWLATITNPSRPGPRGALVGASFGLALLICTISLVKYRSDHARAEFQRVISRYRDAPSSLRVLDGSNRVLWSLRSKGEPESLSLPEPTELHYGVVPSDFVQEVPSAGLPRPFVMGEAIEIQVEFPRTFQTAKGYARGPDRVEQLQLSSRNR
jgi:hypothetical protein